MSTAIVAENLGEQAEQEFMAYLPNDDIGEIDGESAVHRMMRS